MTSGGPRPADGGRTAYVVTPDMDVPEIIDVALIVSLSPIGGSTSGTRVA